MELKTRSLFEFGAFRLEPAEHRLTRDNQQVSLPPKTFELLVYLVENHGRLVTKDQIMRAVWPGSFVEDANLTVSISALRKILGKDDSDLQYIETVPKRGYRFTVPVTEVKSPESIPTQRGEEASSLAGISRFEPQGPLLVSPSVRRVNRRSRIVIGGFAVLACVLAIAIGYVLLSEKRTSGLHSAGAAQSCHPSATQPQARPGQRLPRLLPRRRCHHQARRSKFAHSQAFFSYRKI